MRRRLGSTLPEEELAGGEALRGRLFGRSTTAGDPTLPAGEGFTDKFGNITFSTSGTATQQNLVRFHETVHSALSPKFVLLRNLRADIAMFGYNRSHLLRYIEEALAETYAQLRVNGISGLLEGLRFPIKNGYVTVSRLVTEAAIGTTVVGGITYGVYIAAEEATEVSAPPPAPGESKNP